MFSQHTNTKDIVGQSASGTLQHEKSEQSSVCLFGASIGANIILNVVITSTMHCAISRLPCYVFRICLLTNKYQKYKSVELGDQLTSHVHRGPRCIYKLSFDIIFQINF